MFEHRCILKTFAAALLVAMLITLPAAAQSTVPVDVKPGDTIEIGQEEIVLELVDLRNQSTLNPITELRQYKMDDPAMQVTKVIPVNDDTYVKINSRSLGGTYGRYYPYNAKDGVIKNSIIFVQAPPTVTMQPVTATPTGPPTTMATPATPAETTATPTTQIPLSPLAAIGALGISLFVYMAWFQRR
ncbi:hypothetical protein FGU65_08915 [Methanoculleus sp. FWC-SCC1]|uniref:PGF-CTERM sorting domain-containing protein n=1 Tax=Methanoculleus frigidifontis TaxID=2584085 RepID=A0ABT8MAP5_9EURY|nr:hypothetical protein [Methanoculleus sp. FWC-SCC1]MDN7025005.1 hypothetical protein [Methanoculleus sp. FWC-SCC1]